jgi:DNA polymerase III subunit delta
MSDFSAIQQDVKSRRLKPVYLLHGEEPFFIDQAVSYLEQELIPEAHRAFDQSVFYGRDTKVEQVKDTLLRYPVLSEYQLVIIREAQAMEKLEELSAYLENPIQCSVLVIAYRNKKYDARKQLYKIIKQVGFILESKALYDNQLPAWISKQGESLGLKISPDISTYLSENLGNDLSKIQNELQKLQLNLISGSTVRQSDVEKYIGISKEYNFFEFQKQLSTGSIPGIMKIGLYMANNDKSFNIIQLISMLFTYFQKVYKMHALTQKSDKEIMAGLGLSSPYFISEYKMAIKHYSRNRIENIFQTLRQFDQKSKGFGAIGLNNSALVKELISHILPEK